MLDVRPGSQGWRLGDLKQLKKLCSNLSSESRYKDLWDYVVVKPKWGEIFPADQYISEETLVTFQNTMLPVLLPVIGYSHIHHMSEVKTFERLQQLIDEGWLGTSSVPINFMSGRSVSQFLHLVRFMGIRYPSLAQGLSKLRKKEWREIEEAARKDGFEFKDTDYRNYTFGERRYDRLLLPVWIRHRLGHPENESEEDFPTESDYRRAIAILGAALAGKAYSDTNDNGHS